MVSLVVGRAAAEPAGFGLGGVGVAPVVVPAAQQLAEVGVEVGAGVDAAGLELVDVERAPAPDLGDQVAGLASAAGALAHDPAHLGAVAFFGGALRGPRWEAPASRERGAPRRWRLRSTGGLRVRGAAHNGSAWTPWSSSTMNAMTSSKSDRESRLAPNPMPGVAIGWAL